MEIESQDCLRCRHLLSAAMDGEATFNETEYVRKHLESCPDCRETQQAYNNLRAQFRLSPAPEPPLALRMAVMSRMNGKKAVYANRKPVVGLSPLLAPWQKGLFAAAVLVLVFVAGFFLSLLLVGQPFEVEGQPVADTADQKVVIIFTRPVDRNFIMANAPALFSIKDAQNKPLQIDTANIVIDGNRVELPIKRESGQLQENEQIQVVVAPDIKDEKGAAVANPGPKVAVVATQAPNVASNNTRPGQTQVVAVVTTTVPAASPTGVTTTAPPAAQVTTQAGNPASTAGPPATTAAPSTGAASTTGTTAAPTTARPATASPGATVSPTAAVTTTVATTATASPTVAVTTTAPAGTSLPSPSTPVTTTAPASTAPPSPTSQPTATGTASPTVPLTTAPPTARPTTPATLPPTATGTPVVSGTATVAPSTVPDTITPSTTVSTPAASPSPSATVCEPVDLGSGFDKLYQNVQARLGCPTSAPAKAAFTYQVFQKGSMLYFQQTGRIYVFYNFGGWASYRAAGAVAVPPTATPAPSVTPGSATPDPTGCSLKPRGSFGILWSNNQAVQTSLGCPVDVDASTTGGLSQNFSRGMMLYNPLAALPYLVIYSDGGFQAFLG